jgi:hypothetical protein
MPRKRDGKGGGEAGDWEDNPLGANGRHRGAAGKFKESDDVGKSLAVDCRKGVKTKVKSGQGDNGDQ